jgi:hypothetical protein
MKEDQTLTLEAQAIRYCQDSGCLGDMDGRCAEGYGAECIEDWCQPCLTEALLHRIEEARAQRDELLGAVKNYRTILRPWLDKAVGRPGTVTFTEWLDAVDKLNEAIAKAEG